MDTAPESTAANHSAQDPVPESRWLNDRLVETPYLHAQALRLTKSLLDRYRGHFEDTSSFNPIAQVIHRDKMLEIFLAVTTPGIREELNCSEYHRIAEPARESADELLDALWTHPKTRDLFREAIQPWLGFARRAFEQQARDTNDAMVPRFEELRRLFGLTDTELDALVAGMAIKECIWRSIDLDGRKSRRNRIWAAMLGIPVNAYLALIYPKSRLRRFHCVDDDGQLDDSLVAFLAGMDDKPISSNYFRAVETEPLPWGYFGELAENHGAFLKRILSVKAPGHGPNILLYGEPGTGKTSLALALAAETGRTPYLVAQTKTKPEGEQGTDFRLAAVRVCDGQVSPSRSLIIVDEADQILTGGADGVLSRLFGGGSPSEKGALNDLLDTVRTPCVWITNTPPGTLDSSNLRRFDYSIRFDKLGRSQRAAIWRHVVAKHRVEAALPEPVLARLAERHEVSAGGIDLAVRNLAALIGAGDAAEPAEQVVDRILASHCDLLGVGRAKRAQSVCQGYSLEGLRIKTPIPLDRIERSLRGFVAHHANGLPKDTDSPRMTLLLSGPPGTGKTEFVKHLGHVLDSPVVVKMGSDLLGMWVGETEKNISAAFRDASSQRAILFMDEFDGLLQSRNNAQRSWEVTQVNELLHQMEDFDGIFVAATNFSENLDAAAIRRFTFKVEFDYLDAAGKTLFFERLFGRTLDDAQRSRLSAIPNLAPGDYRTARQSLFYLGDTSTTDDYLAALQSESAAKAQGRRAVGPVGFR